MNEKKSVLIVINSMELGGAQKSLLSFLKCLTASPAARDYAVDVMVAKPCGLFHGQLPAGISAVDAPAELTWLGTPSGHALLRERPSLKGRLGKLLWKVTNKQRLFHPRLNEEQRLWRNWRHLVPENPRRYDIAVSYMNGFPGYYVMDKVRADLKVLWIHNEYEKLRYDHAFDAPYYAACDRVITISDTCRQSFLEAFPQYADRIAVLENITLAADILQRGREGEAPEFGGAACRLVSVGRLSAQKQFDLAVSAAALLDRHGLNFTWLIVGEGDDRAGLQKQIDDSGLAARVKLIGLRDNPYAYLDRCHIFVQTSRFEGRSIVLDEAKIFSKPIVATNYPTVYDNLADGKTGLIAAMTPEAVAGAIERLWNDPALRRHLADNLAAAARGNEQELQKYLSVMLGGA